jgi:hypothetical protein
VRARKGFFRPLAAMHHQRNQSFRSTPIGGMDA